MLICSLTSAYACSHAHTQEDFFGCISRFVEAFEETRHQLAAQKVRGIDKLISAAQSGEAVTQRRVTRKLSIANLKALSLK